MQKIIDLRLQLAHQIAESLAMNDAKYHSLQTPMTRTLIAHHRVVHDRFEQLIDLADGVRQKVLRRFRDIDQDSPEERNFPARARGHFRRRARHGDDLGDRHGGQKSVREGLECGSHSVDAERSRGLPSASR